MQDDSEALLSYVRSLELRIATLEDASGRPLALERQHSDDLRETASRLIDPPNEEEARKKFRTLTWSELGRWRRHRFHR